MKTRLFQQGKIIFHEGDAASQLFLIRSGQVEVYRSRLGREVALGTLGPGEILGTLACITGGPRLASARAVSDATLTCIPRERLSSSMQTSLPRWLATFVKDLVFRLDHLDQLYVSTVLAMEHLRPSGNDAVALLVQVAKGACVFADLVAASNMEQERLTLSAMLERLATIVGGGVERLRGSLEIFVSAGLVRQRAAGEDTMLVRDEAERLRFFSDFADERKNPNLAALLSQPLTQPELDLLDGILSLARKAPPSPSGSFGISFDRLAKTLPALEKMLPYIPTLERAHGLGLVSIRRTSPDPLVTFKPDDLELMLKSLQALYFASGLAPADKNVSLYLVA